jgi:Xaa-Pro aminopeptidase
VTRTYPVGGRFSGPGRALYEAVLAAQQAALEACLPGQTLHGVHDVATRKLVEGLVDIGLLSGDVDELIAEEKHKAFYMHSTSHWLGLDVHDVGEYTIDGHSRELEPGMVLTVEPGIYIPPDTDDVEACWRGMGIRIEDNVAVTRDEPRILTAGLAKTAGEIEELMAA